MDQITTNITTEPSPSDRYQHHHHQHQHLHHINKYNTQHKCSYTHTHQNMTEKAKESERAQQDFGHAYINEYINLMIALSQYFLSRSIVRYFISSLFTL